MVPGTIELKDGNIIQSLLIFLDESTYPRVNNLRILTGEYFSPMEVGAILDASFASEYGYSVGDTLTIGIQGFYTDIKVRGIGVSPEFLMLSVNPNFFIPMKGSLGVVFLPMSLVKDIFGYHIFNNISVQFSNEKARESACKEIRRVLSDKEILMETLREDQYSYQAVKKRLESYSVFLPSIIAIFNSVTFLITFIVINRMVNTQRREIGTLLSLGYHPATIILVFGAGGVLLGLLGSALGGVGAFCISSLITKAFQDAGGFPIILPVVLPWPLLKGLCFGTASTAVASILPVWKLVKRPPHEIITGKETVTFRHFSRFARRLEGFLLKTISPSFFIKSSFRNILRQKKLIFFTALSIGFALALATTFAVTATSMQESIGAFLRGEQWDLVVNFDKPTGMEHIKKIQETQGITAIAPYIQGFARIRFGSYEKAQHLIAMTPEPPMKKLPLLKGNLFSSDEASEIILTKDTSNYLGAKIGNILNIEIGEQVYSLKLIGIMNDFVLGQSFVPWKFGQEALNIKQKASGVFVQISSDTNTVEKSLYQLDFVSLIISKKKMEEAVKHGQQAIFRFLRIYRILALFVVFLLILTMLNINILDRESEYAILRAIGCGRLLLKKMIFIEVGIVATISIIVSIPLTEMMARFLFEQIAKAIVVLDLYLEYQDFLLTLLPAAVLMIIAIYPGLKYIFNIKVAQSIRNRIMG
jgi:putative ABC transport system permease protein